MTKDKMISHPWVHNGTWVQDGMDILTETGVQIATTSSAGFIGGVSDDANASHIVRCVNSYDSLVQALEHCKKIFLRYEINRVDHEDIEDDALKIIQIALSKAGAA